MGLKFQWIILGKISIACCIKFNWLASAVRRPITLEDLPSFHNPRLGSICFGCSHQKKHPGGRAGHEEIHSEAEVTALGAGVLGGTVHVEVEGAAEGQQDQGQEEQEAAGAQAEPPPRWRSHR